MVSLGYPCERLRFVLKLAFPGVPGGRVHRTCVAGFALIWGGIRSS